MLLILGRMDILLNLNCFLNSSKSTIGLHSSETISNFEGLNLPQYEFSQFYRQQICRAAGIHVNAPPETNGNLKKS